MNNTELVPHQVNAELLQETIDTTGAISETPNKYLVDFDVYVNISENNTQVQSRKFAPIQNQELTPQIVNALKVCDALQNNARNVDFKSNFNSSMSQMHLNITTMNQSQQTTPQQHYTNSPGYYTSSTRASPVDYKNNDYEMTNVTSEAHSVQKPDGNTHLRINIRSHGGSTQNMEAANDSEYISECKNRAQETQYRSISTKNQYQNFSTAQNASKLDNHGMSSQRVQVNVLANESYSDSRQFLSTTGTEMRKYEDPPMQAAQYWHISPNGELPYAFPVKYAREPGTCGSQETMNMKIIVEDDIKDIREVYRQQCLKSNYKEVENYYTKGERSMLKSTVRNVLTDPYQPLKFNINKIKCPQKHHLNYETQCFNGALNALQVGCDLPIKYRGYFLCKQCKKIIPKSMTHPCQRIRCCAMIACAEVFHGETDMVMHLALMHKDELSAYFWCVGCDRLYPETMSKFINGVRICEQCVQLAYSKQRVTQNISTARLEGQNFMMNKRMVNENDPNLYRSKWDDANDSERSNQIKIMINSANASPKNEIRSSQSEAISSAPPLSNNYYIREKC